MLGSCLFFKMYQADWWEGHGILGLMDYGLKRQFLCSSLWIWFRKSWSSNNFIDLELSFSSFSQSSNLCYLELNISTPGLCFQRRSSSTVPCFSEWAPSPFVLQARNIESSLSAHFSASFQLVFSPSHFTYYSAFSLLNLSHHRFLTWLSCQPSNWFPCFLLLAFPT